MPSTSTNSFTIQLWKKMLWSSSKPHLLHLASTLGHQRLSHSFKGFPENKSSNILNKDGFRCLVSSLRSKYFLQLFGHICFVEGTCSLRSIRYSYCEISRAHLWYIEIFSSNNWVNSILRPELRFCIITNYNFQIISPF